MKVKTCEKLSLCSLFILKILDWFTYIQVFFSFPNLLQNVTSLIKLCSIFLGGMGWVLGVLFCWLKNSNLGDFVYKQANRSLLKNGPKLNNENIFEFLHFGFI